MGSGIAQVAATVGQNVCLIDTSDEVLAQAVQKIEWSLNKFSEKGHIKENPKDVLERIKTSSDLASVSDADFVIEAVFEDISLKKKIFSEIDIYAPQKAILATNTSSLSITMISEATSRREKVIGMHWMNPPQLMKLVEITKSKYTDDETLQSIIGLCKIYDKEPIIVHKDVWYFLAGRARFGWSSEANLMYLRKEADIREIDAVARYKVGLPMGEFELMDFTGAVDIRTKGLESTEEILKAYPEFEPCPMFLAVFRQLTQELWRPMSEKGLSGIKSGKGFYSYPERKYIKPEIPKELADKVEPIQLLAPALNVAAWCVSGGIGSIDDINKSFRLAYGWPKGILEFIDEYGANNIIGILKAKEEKAQGWLKEFYKPDPLLTKWKVKN